MTNPRAEDSLASLCQEIRGMSLRYVPDESERDAMREVCDRAEKLLEAVKFYATAEAYEVDSDRGSIARKALTKGDL